MEMGGEQKNQQALKGKISHLLNFGTTLIFGMIMKKFWSNKILSTCKIAERKIAEVIEIDQN